MNNFIYNLFDGQYVIFLFYEPSNEGDDVFYHLILDNDITVVLRYYEDKKIIVIRDVIPLDASRYIPDVYAKFVSFLMKQENISIYASRLGNTKNLDDACINLKVPLVDNTYYEVFPDDLIEEYEKYYKGNPTKLKNYLFTKEDYANNNPVKKKKKKRKEVKKEEVKEKPVIKEPEIVEPIKEEPIKINEYKYASDDIRTILLDTFSHNPSFNNLKILDGSSDELFTLASNIMSFYFKKEEDRLYILKFLPNGYTTNVTAYMILNNAFNMLEIAARRIKVPIVIKNVTIGPIYSICLQRKYERLNVMLPNDDRNIMGSYVIPNDIHNQTDIR